MLTNSKSKKPHRQAAKRPTDKQWEIIVTIGISIIIGTVAYFIGASKKAEAAVVARASVVSSRPSSSLTSRSYTSYSTRSSSATRFRATPARSVSKPSTIRSLKPVSTPARSVQATSPNQQKKNKKSGFEYDYYAFNDCTPYSSINFQGWKCIDRD